MAMDGQESTPKSASKASRGLVDMFAIQCVKCLKWRVIPTQEEYEDIRSKFMQEKFSCDKRPNVSCDDPADIEYDTTRTWVIDKPNIPKTPVGFKRSMILRKDFSKFDAYYITPNGKRLKSRPEVASYLEANPGCKDIAISDFNFSTPKIMEDTIPEFVVRKSLSSGTVSGKRSRMSADDA